MVKKLPANALDLRDASSIPGLGRSCGGGHGNTLQYSGLENPLDRGACVKVSQLGLTLCDPMDCPWSSPGQNTGVGNLSLLQGIFPMQGLNAGLPHYRQILYHLSQAWQAIIHRVIESRAQLKQLRTAHVSHSSSLRILRAKIHPPFFFFL